MTFVRIEARQKARIAATALVLLAACQTEPQTELPGAASPPLVARDIAGAGFVHTVFEPTTGNVVDGDAAEPLFVFLEGDGRPWTAHGMQPSTNPDPRRAVALE